MVYRLLCWIEYEEGWNANDTQDVSGSSRSIAIFIIFVLVVDMSCNLTAAAIDDSIDDRYYILGGR